MLVSVVGVKRNCLEDSVQLCHRGPQSTSAIPIQRRCLHRGARGAVDIQHGDGVERGGKRGGERAQRGAAAGRGKRRGGGGEVLDHCFQLGEILHGLLQLLAKDPLGLLPLQALLQLFLLLLHLSVQSHDLVAELLEARRRVRRAGLLLLLLQARL